ncbi:2Fe-2S iron-sulfur cluster-binding protein [Pseudidiomarina sp.]|uniref:2Fe-2S iron-sulfur cluster-binding protein n=1 Tax=Pseudidiomarina sp. TaxID=2081707 RepID=UPI00299DDD6C|nr:2Fe-2S iron-sulfur cluster-binding protein [Pseudidiomarina sp.]MDX1706373.1 2Fe-2S iron-sulfur cluster-binding protein [Pseudidiomarina sp.]
MMRFFQWLHRWVSLILVIQVLLWLVSGFYFSLSGHHGMSGHQYLEHGDHAMLSDVSPGVDIADIRARYPDTETVRLHSTAGIPQFIVTTDDTTHYLNGITGDLWHTDPELAKRIALATYNGPGEVAAVTAIQGSDEILDWNDAGYRIDLEDDLNTRIYIDAASGQMLNHRNTPWTIADWAFRLHFMDYTGGRSFNHLLIWSAGLFALWFSLSGLILLVNNFAKGDMNPRRKPTMLEQLQREQKPVASSCGGGGTCGLCKVTLEGERLPEPTTAEKVLLSESELEGGLRLSCQHRVDDRYTVKLPDHNAATVTLELAEKRLLSPSIVELTFKSSEAVEYQAGQFMQFCIPHREQVLTRHYSMATPFDPHRFVFTVRQMPSPGDKIPPGIGSTYLCALEKGAMVETIGPFGDFVLSQGNQRTQLFIGGGAGIAPLRALLQTELAKAQPRDCVFFYGARHVSELCYRNEFTAATGVSYIPVISESEENRAWTGARGFVHEEAQAWIKHQNVEQLDVYVCGPPPMLKATMAMLAEAGVPRNQIRFDDFGI